MTRSAYSDKQEETHFNNRGGSKICGWSTKSCQTGLEGSLDFWEQCIALDFDVTSHSGGGGQIRAVKYFSDPPSLLRCDLGLCFLHSQAPSDFGSHRRVGGLAALEFGPVLPPAQK